jgi:hypothetical protein
MSGKRIKSNKKQENKSVQQASRRSWRIGQTLDVKVVFLGYEDTAQTTLYSG